MAPSMATKRQRIRQGKKYLKEILFRHAKVIYQAKKGLRYQTIRVHPRRKLNLNKFFYPLKFIWRYLAWQTFLFVGFFLFVLCFNIWLYQFVFKNLPSASDLTKKAPAVSSKILDRHGQLLYNIYQDENRTIVPLNQISPFMIDATIAIEDKDFYHHIGFSPLAIIRAFIANQEGKPIQGGSTITQQLVKNRLLSPEKTIRRKVRELLLAVMVERKFSKQQILTMYLNQVAYGGSAYGVEEAAQRYFGKSAKQLDLAEAALLAGLPAAPSSYSPFGANPELAFKRQKEVLRRMAEDHFISKDEAKKAAAEPILFRNNIIDIKAPHFVMYVKRLLAQQYGEQMLSRGGLKVTTTLDFKLQEKVQQIVTHEVNRLNRLHVTNGAALVINPQTGEILAMVGSKNYFDFNHGGQVNVTLRARQPGSSIKPLTYALAFSHGLNPATKILDAPITYFVKGSKPYSPRNYDSRYHGLVSLRRALASSYNIPATKLLNRLGVSKLIDLAQEMGITTWNDRKRFGLSLTLGAGEVRMIDLAQAYSIFADQGKKVKLNPILEVKNYHGKVLYRNQCALDKHCPAETVLSPAVAYQVTDVLKDNRARTPAFGPFSVLNIPGQEVAVKTGTTNNLRDNWAIGYTSNRLVATWVGNNDNSSMSHIASGITGASPIWNKIMRNLLDAQHPHKFKPPSDVVFLPICSKQKTPIKTQTHSAQTLEVFRKGDEPSNNCWIPISYTLSRSPSKQPK